ESALPGSTNDIDEVSATLWEVETGPGGPVIAFNGTVEEFFAHVSDAYPDYLDKAFDLEAVFGFPSVEKREVGRRTDFSAVNPRCWSSSNLACDAPAISTGINYLRGVKGKPTLPANGSSRVSCSWNSGIRWINHVSSITPDLLVEGLR
ncbi:hypothetical protein ACHAQA_010192, partial [Verticillium albo-atrum]